MHRLYDEAEYPKCVRTMVRYLIAMTIVAGPIVLESCGGGSPNFNETTVPPQIPVAPIAVAFPPDSAHGICIHADSSGGGTRMNALMDTLKWAPGCIPMYTDDQRFHNGVDGKYGPLAHIAPLPSDTFSTMAKFNVPLTTAVLVGAVLVDTTDEAVLPTTYQSLGLTPGFNCVFLRHDAGTDDLTGWHAYVTKLVSVSSTNYCPAPASEQGLHVFPMQDAAFKDTSDYPLVGRFREATYAGHQSYPLLGFKCVAAFCLIGPGSAPDHPHLSDHVGVHKNARTWQVFGWNDEQHVGLAAAAAGPIQPQWTWNGSIVAAAGLGKRTIADFSADSLVHVATVFLKTPPPRGSKYETKWRFEKGENYIFLHHAPTSGPNDGWTGVVRHHFKPTLLDKALALAGKPYEFPVKVTRIDHSGVKVAGTVRFKWSETDEDGWARCDEGCCRIESIL
jgi:hypothetical protein